MWRRVQYETTKVTVRKRKRDEIPTEEKEQGKTKKPTVDSNRTGAKLVGWQGKQAHGSGSGEWGQSSRQSVGLTRLKSGRSDLPKELVTTSMSCSDKLCLASYAGFQSALLSRFLRSPLKFKSLTISRPPDSSKEAVHNAVTRALWGRIERVCTTKDTNTQGGFFEGSDPPKINICEEKFVNHRLEVERKLPELGESSDANQNKRRKKIPASGVAINWYEGGGVEVVTGAFGRKQGASSRQISKKTCSRLSKPAMWGIAIEVAKSLGVEGESWDYSQWKQSAEWYKRLKNHLKGPDGPLRPW
eukprot:CAMPEP_0170188686 /NCGR_PEP_ID=MMETSP0040_2-20121228/44973_1 /TAXON_ID=641309 /ORGANISM="Lotharella oceanica, Strain CCMP622" /LENGTH=301 /DNA_ID=CAMNT_0010436037 /DNA_START=59 /DNA_END=962 /DNA_ORIENTATION=+